MNLFDHWVLQEIAEEIKAIDCDLKAYRAAGEYSDPVVLELRAERAALVSQRREILNQE